MTRREAMAAILGAPLCGLPLAAAPTYAELEAQWYREAIADGRLVTSGYVSALQGDLGDLYDVNGSRFVRLTSVTWANLNKGYYTCLAGSPGNRLLVDGNGNVCDQWNAVGIKHVDLQATGRLVFVRRKTEDES